MAALTLTSSAFAAGGRIPERHTCDGDDVSPPLAWSAPPPETRSLALVVDDPDAPGDVWSHWVVWAIDPSRRELAEGEAGGLEGTNDFGARGYGGPCPPRGDGDHRYSFRLYALAGEPALDEGASREALLAAISDPLAVAELIGLYGR